MKKFMLLCLLIGSYGSFAATKDIALSADMLAKAKAPRRIAVLLGVGEFKDKKYPSLLFPEKDANDFAEFLKNHNQGDFDKTFTLTGRRMTFAGINQIFEQLEQENTSERDTVIVYLSTHGTLAYNEQKMTRYAALYDSAYDSPQKTALPIYWLENRLVRLRSQKKALVLALCHAGSGKSALPKPLSRELATMKGVFFGKPLHEVSEAMMVLSASSWGQPAREDPALRNDIYTHFLLRGLQANDSNNDGAVSLYEAHEYARAMTYDYTRGQQTPSALVNLQGMDPIILSGEVKSRGRPMIVADSEAFRTLRLEVDGIAKGSLWQPIAAPEGRVRVALANPERPERKILDDYMYFQQEKTYTVSDMLNHRPQNKISLLAGTIHQNMRQRQSSVAVGAAVDFDGFLGFPYNLTFSYSRLSQAYEAPIGDVPGEIRLQASILNFGIGIPGPPIWGFIPVSYGMIEYAIAERELDHTGLERRHQSLSIVNPGILGEIYRPKIWNDMFASFGVGVFLGSRKPLAMRLKLGTTI